MNEEACIDCGDNQHYVDPDSHRCDLCAVVARIVEDQQPLGVEFETVWDQNARNLYEA